jgi:uncharacterized cupredoxin-like copper-binding protein
MKAPLLLALPVLTLLAAPLAAAPGAPGHAHDTFAAGEPGKASRVKKTVEILMKEGDGTMSFEPARLEVRRGETVRFVVRNVGELEHEIVIDSVEGNAKHAREMEKFPEMEHDDPNAIRLKPGKNGEMIWRFSKRGTFEYACLIPGHHQAGMKGTIVVK